MRIGGLLISCLMPPIAVWHAAAQTQVDLRTQSKSVDFSAASSTKPSKTGTTLPTTCSTGETFFKTDAAAGKNLYGCTSANVWTPLGLDGTGVDSVGISMPVEFTVSGSPVTSSGTLTVTKANQNANTVFAGPAVGSPAAPAFRALAGADIPDLSPTYQPKSEKNTAGGYAGLNAAGQLSASQGQEVWALPDLSDVSGKQGNTAVVQMFGGGGAQADDCAKFDVNGNVVSHGAPCGSGVEVANYAKSFVSQTSVTVPGFDHALGTSNLIVDCYDNGTPARRIEPDSVTVNAITYDVTITFSKTQSGKCVVNGSGGGTAGGGSVWSVFGRTGNVAAQTGDYAFSQISGTVSNAQIGSGVDTTKLGTGSVDSAEFGYLDGVRSPIQAQLDSKASSSHTHATAGDLAGDIGSATVTALRNRSVAATTPQDGQALTWNATLSQWEPATVSGSGGASAASQLADFQVTRSSSTVLTIGANCSSSVPCNVRFGNTTYSFQSGATVTISAGTGTAHIYVTPSGTLTVGHNLTLTCSSCSAVSSVTSFPSDSVPIFTWTATGGVWDASGGSDKRAFLSAKTLIGGTGVALSELAGQTTVTIDAAVVGLRVAVPASAGASCNSSEWALDSQYLYLCVAASTWKRVMLSAW